jgi:hypothetical protein
MGCIKGEWFSSTQVDVACILTMILVMLHETSISPVIHIATSISTSIEGPNPSIDDMNLSCQLFLLWAVFCWHLFFHGPLMLLLYKHQSCFNPSRYSCYPQSCPQPIDLFSRTHFSFLVHCRLPYKFRHWIAKRSCFTPHVGL